MGCGASLQTPSNKIAPEQRSETSADSTSNITKKETNINKKESNITKKKTIISKKESNDSVLSTKSNASERWGLLKTKVLTGDYTSWEECELNVVEDEFEIDYFDALPDTHDDYGDFMKGDHGECDHEVRWNDKLLAKLYKDSSPRGFCLRDAKIFGDQHGLQDRHVTVIYNPIGGGGKAKRMVARMVVPVLLLAKLKFTVMPTRYRRHAIEVMRTLNVETTDAVIVCGGDGLVHEAITGYFLHANQKRLREKISIGITPCGTANAMANALHTHANRTALSLVGRATLAVAKGHTRKVDVLKCVQDVSANADHTSLKEIYALSCFGWGMAGAVALKADKLRWIPGQRTMRYDIAGFVSLIRDWPIADRGLIEYREEDGTSEGAPWVKQEISLVNLITSNLEMQSKKYPIHPDIQVDDGCMAFTYINAIQSRGKVINIFRKMKQGKYLAMMKGVTSLKLKEFKITPLESKSPYLIDGDPHDVCPVHVTCLHKALKVFVLPAADLSCSPRASVASELRDDHLHGDGADDDDDDQDDDGDHVVAPRLAAESVAEDTDDVDADVFAHSDDTYSDSDNSEDYLDLD